MFDFIVKHGDLLITRVTPHPPIGHSDHMVVEFDIAVCVYKTCLSPTIDYIVPKYQWCKTDFDAMSAYLACVDWAILYYTNPCASTLWSAFCQVLSTAIDLFVPCTSPASRTINTSYKKKSIVPKNMQKCVIARRKLWRKLRCSPNDIQLQIKYHFGVEADVTVQTNNS